MDADNRVSLHGRLVELDALRYTPAGVPIVKFRLAHESEQSEGGALRKVGCEVAGVAFEAEAKRAPRRGNEHHRISGP